MDEARLTKLPRWAQQYIRKLQKDVAWYKEQLRQLDTASSPLTWEVITGDSTIHGIPERATITFALPDGEIDFRLRDEQIHVSAQARKLIIEPGGGVNVIKLSCKKW